MLALQMARDLAALYQDAFAAPKVAHPGPMMLSVAWRNLILQELLLFGNDEIFEFLHPNKSHIVPCEEWGKVLAGDRDESSEAHRPTV